MFKVPEQYRVIRVPFFPDTKEGNKFGVFVIPSVNGRLISCIADDGTFEGGWEHVSVSIRDGNKSRIPTWDEMCKVKDLFWDKADCVVQYHPPEDDYVNTHPNVLHLWRPLDGVFPMPPKSYV